MTTLTPTPSCAILMAKRLVQIPGQIKNAGNNEGSAGWAINAQGQIAGRWRDLNLALHGFLRLPNNRHSAEILP